jgi:putative drug exporter of the RND superfamily
MPSKNGISPNWRLFLYDIMRFMYVRRFWVAGVVLAAVVALLPFSFHAERHLETATRVEGSEAETVWQELVKR